MKKVLAISLALVMVAMSLSGCVSEQPTSAAEPAPATEAAPAAEAAAPAPAAEEAAPAAEEAAPAKDGPIKVMHSGTFLSHEFQQRMIQGFEYYCETNGYELTVSDANGDIAKQIADLEGYITAGADVITVKPVEEMRTKSWTN